MSDHQHDPILDSICNRSHWIIQPGITAACDTLTQLLQQARAHELDKTSDDHK